MDTVLAPPSRPWIDRAWPLPALLTWAGCWALAALVAPAAGAPAALAAGTLLGGALALRSARRARRMALAAGFPLSALALTPGLPGLWWLLPLALLLLLYPRRAWSDAPLFPTPPGALDALAARLTLPPGASVLDAGCGRGDGLRALRSAWPQARVEGVEWSAPLAAWAAWRCRFARVRRGDMWAAPWGGQALVSLFQRPESMPRAWDKACREMAPGSWLVSLEFGLPARAPDLAFTAPSGRPVLAWRIPAQSPAAGADNPREPARPT